MTPNERWTRQLCPVERDGHEAVCFPQTLQLALNQVGHGPVAWAVEVAFGLTQQTTDLIPYLGGVEQAVRAMRPITEALTIAMLLAIDAGEADPARQFPEAEQDLAALIGRRVPMERIFSAQMKGHARLAETFLSACRALVPPAEQPAEMELVSRILFDVANSFAERTTEVLLSEERRWLASSAAKRHETVRAVLAQKNFDAKRASRELGYDLLGCYHVALVCRDERGAEADSRQLLGAATSLLRTAGAEGQIVMPVSHTEVWAWGAFRERPLPHPIPMPPELDVLVAVGRAQPGVEGFRSSHDEAQATAQLAGHGAVMSSGGRIVDYDDVRLTTLLSADSNRALSFMRDELGALYDCGETERTLRETIRVYLECNCRPQDAARRLHVAKNTVVYRVKRAEELLGHDVRTRQFELWAALRLAAIREP